MKPLLSHTQESESLQALGRASVQIVHDLKNQLNGLKLYATFLRKRLEKGNRPQDELETVDKLMAGLERAASDLSTLVQYGQPIELKKQPGVEIGKILRTVVSSVREGGRSTGPLQVPLIVDSPEVSLSGDFDPVVLSQALKSISLGAGRLQSNRPVSGSLSIRLARDENRGEALIEWQCPQTLDHDPFRAFAGSDEIRMSLAAKIVEAHGGAAESEGNVLRVRLPLTVSDARQNDIGEA